MFWVVITIALLTVNRELPKFVFHLRKIHLICPFTATCIILQRAFRINVSTRLDDRVYALEQCKTLPVSYLIQMLHPDLYPVHTILEVVSV